MGAQTVIEAKTDEYHKCPGGWKGYVEQRLRPRSKAYRLRQVIVYHPLIAAVLANNFNVAQLLVDRGSDIQNKNLQKMMLDIPNNDIEREKVKTFIKKNTLK